MHFICYINRSVATKVDLTYLAYLGSFFATSLFCQFVIPMTECNMLDVAVKVYCK